MEASNLLDGASIRELRATLPNGVPKIFSAVCPLIMYRTSLTLTGTNVQLATPRMQPRASTAVGALSAFTLMSWLGPNVASAAVQAAPPNRDALNGLDPKLG